MLIFNTVGSLSWISFVRSEKWWSSKIKPQNLLHPFACPAPIFFFPSYKSRSDWYLIFSIAFGIFYKIDMDKWSFFFKHYHDFWHQHLRTSKYPLTPCIYLNNFIIKINIKAFFKGYRVRLLKYIVEISTVLSRYEFFAIILLPVIFL